MIVTIAIGIFFIILGYFLLITCMDTDTAISGFVSYLSGIFGMIFIGLGIFGESKSTIPSAMDVYQGKTTLQYTYKDSVKIDSIVVFKEMNNYEDRN